MDRLEHRRPWLISGVPRATPHGGPLRARHLFADLAERTGAKTLPHFGGRGLPRALAAWHFKRAQLASTELIDPHTLRLLSMRVTPEALDLHDSPVEHLDALGLPLSAGERRRVERMVTANYAAFGRIVVQSAAFAELATVPEHQRITIPNGTDTRHIRAHRLSDAPVVVTMSGAAPGRGLELMVEAMKEVRSIYPDSTLRMGLVPTGRTSAQYLEQLRRLCRRLTWVEIVSVPYASLSPFLAEARVFAIPHPPHPYWDAILPIKLFDGLASGRPLATTPRTETASLVRGADAGLVASGDMAVDLAAVIGHLLNDDRLSSKLGARGRLAAESRYDWRVLSAALADAVLGPQNASR